MKRLATIAGIALFAIVGSLQLIHSLATDDPIGYFTEHPSRLLWVAAIAMTGGVVTWGFYRLPSRAQEHAGTLSLLIIASASTTALGYFVYGFFSLASWSAKNGGGFWSPLSMFLPILLMLPAVAGFCWAAGWRRWRKTASR